MNPQPQHHEKHLASVVMMAHVSPFRTKSDFARVNADHVAIASSLGLISVAQGVFTFTREWRVTHKGLSYLKNLGAIPS